MSYSQYLALGDSMSIDLYAALDAGLTDVSVALERIEASGNVAPVGAPSPERANALTPTMIVLRLSTFFFRSSARSARRGPGCSSWHPPA